MSRHKGDRDGNTPAPPRTLQRRRPGPPSRRPRHFGRARSRVPQVLSVALIAIVMGLGAFFGLLLSHQKTVVVPEMNMGQLLWVLRAKYLVDAQGFNKIQGKPFKQSEIEAKIEEVLS